MNDFKRPDFLQKKEYSESAIMEEVLKSPYIARLCKKESIPVTVVKENPYRFKKWLTNMEPCIACKGLYQCKQKRTGYRNSLSYDGLLQEVLEACPYETQKETDEKHLKQYRINDLSESFYTISFPTLKVENETHTYLKTAKAIANLFYEGEGAYIYGNMGTGKTYLSACACNDAARNGKSVAFVHYPTFCTKLSRMQKSNEHIVLLDQLMSADFVVFDDIGAEEVTAFNRAMLLSLLDKRMQSKRTTWFTSNADFSKLNEHFCLDERYYDNMDANRVMERIRVLSKPVYLDGNDRRSVNE